MTNTQMKTMVFLLLAGFLWGCSHRTHQTHEQEESPQEPTDKTDIPMQNNEFAFDLMRQIPVDNENVVISPFSISTALAMTYAGARETTMEQMAEVMHFDLDQDRFHQAYGAYLREMKTRAADHIELNIANSLWAQDDYHFLDSFFETVEANYDSKTFQVNFKEHHQQITKDINDWVYDETSEKIEDLIAPNVLTNDTRLVLVNAIYFLGAWMKEFDPDLTTEDLFYLRDREMASTDFMRRSDTLPYYEDETRQMLEIPYSGGDFSMLFMLPAEGKSLEEFERNANAASFADMIEKMDEQEVEVFVPSFEAETQIDLENILAHMGMENAFNRFADFSGMTGDLDLVLDKVIHQAVIEVAEEGTEAAAATAVVVIRKTAIDPDEPPIFRANRPFLFFVKDNTTQNILFSGRVMNPS